MPGQLLFAAFGFLTPLFLLGALAALVPLILHLLHRQRAPELPFSTLRFLKLSVEKTARRRRLRDLFLLFFRMMILGLLAIGLAGPFASGRSVLFGSGAAAVAIVIDNSASMGQADTGQTRFDRAQELAHAILDQLEEEDEVVLVPTAGAGAAADAVYQRVANVGRLLDATTVSIAAADVPAAIDRARRILETSSAPNREIYVLSDLQQTSWQSALDEPGPTAQAERDPLILVDVHRARPANLALEEVNVSAERVAVAMPTRIAATIRNGATQDIDAQVELIVDDELIERSQRVRLAAGARHTVELTFQPQSAGIHQGKVSLLGADASSLDNQGWFTIDTQSPARVAIIDDHPAEQQAHTSARYYLERALRPAPERVHAIETTALSSSLAKQEPLAGYSAVIAVDLATRDEELFDRLHDYVGGGGMLLWICGPNNDPEALTEIAQATGLLPGTFAFPAGDQPAGWHWADLDAAHPALAPLAEPASLYLSVTVDRYLRLKIPEGMAARILARLDNGDPALAAHQVGRGNVWTLLCGAHPRWTTLPLRPLFVPLLTRAILTRPDPGLGPTQRVPGAVAVLRFPEETQPVTVEITTPDGAVIRLVSAPQTDSVQAIEFPHTHTPGIYLGRMVEARSPRQFAFAVNPDPREADPMIADAASLLGRLGPAASLVGTEPELRDTIRRHRQGSQWMDLFLLTVLLGGLFEVLLANRIVRQEPLAPPSGAEPPLRATFERARAVHRLDRLPRGHG